MLCELGRTLLEPVQALAAWSAHKRQDIQSARDRFDAAEAKTAARQGT